MSEAFPRHVVEKLVAQFAGVPTTWVDDDQPQLGQGDAAPQAWIELGVSAVTPKGQDDYRQVPHPENPDALLSAWNGYRMYMVNLRAKSLNASVQAFDLLERVRLRLTSVTANAQYDLHNLALVRTHPVAVFRVRADTRTRLEATMDVVFGWVVTAIADDDDGQTIGQINSGGPIPGKVTA